jgi:hypothetical protein
MRAMKGLRPAALAALFALAFSSLLPFLASARMLVADGPVEHCHKLNIDSILDPDPASPEGPSQPRKVTCPFCASAVVAPPGSPPPMPGFVSFDFGIVAPTYHPASHSGAPVRLPPSRAPPPLALS